MFNKNAKVRFDTVAIYYHSDAAFIIKNKAIVNADLNASANIGRKAFPALFNKDAKVRFDTVEVYYHPDATFIAKNKARQKARYKM